MNGNTTEKPLVQSIERALLLLETLAQHQEGCSIKQLSEATGLNKSTVHRILQTLLAFGYVRQSQHNDNYFLGFQILTLSNRLLSEFDIVSLAKPYLRSLCEDTGLVIQLSIRNLDMAVFLDKAENPNQNIRMYSQIGKTIPLYCSSSGKALLAWENDDEIGRTVRATTYTPFTQFTITNHKTFLSEILRIRQKGYATDFFEHEESICCAASPIVNSSGKTIAAICFAGTFLQISAANIPEYIVKIHDTASLLSKKIGCTSYPARLSMEDVYADAKRYDSCIQTILQKFK